MNEEIQKLEQEILEMKARLSELRKAAIAMEVPDYDLTDQSGSTVKLSELFAGKQDLVVIHNMGKSCPYCTLWADGINGVVEHIEDRTALVLVSPDSPEAQRGFASSRNWKFRMFSHSGSDFSKELGFEIEQEGKPFQLPGATGFRLDEEGKIHRVSSTFFGPGDDYCSVWHFYELLEDGYADWQPRYSY